MLNENRFLGTFRGHNTTTITYTNTFGLWKHHVNLLLQNLIYLTYLCSNKFTYSVSINKKYHMI
jgi:hypothetical protein